MKNSGEIEVAILKTQMQEINRRFDELQKNIDGKFDLVFKKFDEMDDKYVSNEKFKVYQVALGLIGTTVMLYMTNMILDTVFQK